MPKRKQKKVVSAPDARHPGPVSVSGTPPLSLSFRGLGHCDSCGTRLEPGEQLAGLCPQCEGAMRKPSLPKRRPRHRLEEKV